MSRQLPSCSPYNLWLLNSRMKNRKSDTIRNVSADLSRNTLEDMFISLLDDRLELQPVVPDTRTERSISKTWW